MAMIKYRVHEVAKDFNTTSKVISQILTDYVAPPKNHMQVLETPELDVIFEYMTQKNQVASLEDIFKVEPPEKKEAATETKGEAPAGEGKTTVQKTAQADKKPAQPKPAQPQAQSQPQQQTSQAQKKKENKPHVPRQVAEKRVVDTRGGAAVNIEKYNEKFEDMAGNKANSSKMRNSGNKEKIKSQAKQRQQAQQQSPAKRRQEERDRQNRLQRELAKKKPLTVEIPDEIDLA